MKITVAIPTVAGRQHYLESAIATCTAQPDSNLEILVSDNSPGDAEAITLRSGDRRVRYIRPPEFLTMAAHWEFMLEHVGGDSLTIIGDDDGLMPGAIGTVTGLLQQLGNVPVHHSLCNYFWPDYPQVSARNSVTFFHDAYAGGKWMDSAAFLLAAALGTQRYVDGPMIYHNFIPMPLVRQIAAGGPFFRRAIPDVYSALAIAANCSRFYSVGQFLTISGQGAKSNGARVQQGASDGTTFNAALAPAWHQPRTSARTVSPLLIDSILEVAERFDRPDLAAAIAYRVHLENAVLETMSLEGAAAKRREFRAIFRLARANGATLPLARWFIGRALGKAERGLGLARRPVIAAQSRDVVMLGPEVRNVADATIALDRLLAQHAAAAAESAIESNVSPC